MSLRHFAGRLFYHGRLILNTLGRRRVTGDLSSHFPYQCPVGGSVGKAEKVRDVTSWSLGHINQLRSQFINSLLTRITSTFASELRRRAAKQLAYGNSAPFFALVGVSLASGSGILTKEEEMETVCEEIREAVRNLHWVMNGSQQKEEVVPTNSLSLDKISLGPVIAKGCNAVVYGAQWKSEHLLQQTEEDMEDDNLALFPLAMKMMFNYDAESNAPTILRAMIKETVPARIIQLGEEGQESLARLNKMRCSLPPHANVVDVKCVFADRVPFLSGSLHLYPDALPKRLHPDGAGRNMSLFLVMKRYDMTLRELLSREQLDMKTRVILLAQLLEGVVHLGRYGVVHRDLKTDNLLVDLSDSPCQPHLVIADFGCCLADSSLGFSLPFPSWEVDRGGNATLMAPEVSCARPGLFTIIDYTKADVWAVGAVSYEILGFPNPFYSSSGTKGLNSTTYNDAKLPALSEEVPGLVANLVAQLLTRKPRKRPSASLAATIVQLYLWAPRSWLKCGLFSQSTPSQIMEWLLSLTAKVLCEARYGGTTGRLEYMLVASFLSRTSLSEVRQALHWIAQQ